mgnify:CR=1 FL=1
MPERWQAALPDYLRTIVLDLYDEHAILVETQQQIEEAMSQLLEHGQQFCVDFGILNAVEKAREIHVASVLGVYLPLEESDNGA